MLICIQTTSVRIDGDTHEELKAWRANWEPTVGRTVSLAARDLRQAAWLDAELG
jgi:hypothetical protein